MLTRLKSGISLLIGRIWGGVAWIFKRAFVHAEFRKIVSEFFVEAGVLIFVFPVLDTVVQFGMRKVTLKMTVGSITIAIGFLFLAGLFSFKEETGG